MLGLVAAGPILSHEKDVHPQWTWIGFALSVVGYLTSRLMPSPKQAQTIKEQKALIDSLRPPPPERNV